MYTEEEAKTKLCPMFRSEDTCIASDCMMWKWKLVEKERVKIAQEQAHGCMYIRELVNSKTNGYCGLSR